MSEAPVVLKADGSPQYSSINARVSSETSVVDSRFVASLDPDVETLTRLESSWTQQPDGGIHRWRLGDSVSSSGSWGSSVRYGGVQFGTRFDVRPDVIGSTKLATSGISALPSVADALLASAGANHTNLQRRRMSLDGGVDIAGPNAIVFVARDSLGRAQRITAPLISDTRLARPGCEEFSIGMGRVREDYAVTSNEYGAIFANSTVLCGAPLGFTVEGHGEFLSDEVAALGLGLSRRLGFLGAASVAFASSEADIGSGWLARFGLDHENELFSLMLRSQMQSREFREVGTLLTSDPIMERALASVGVKVTSESQLALTYAAQTTWEREKVDLIGLSQSLQWGRASLSLSAGHSLVATRGSSLFISFTRPIGGLSNARTSLIDEVEKMIVN